MKIFSYIVIFCMNNPLIRELRMEFFDILTSSGWLDNAIASSVSTVYKIAG